MTFLYVVATILLLLPVKLIFPVKAIAKKKLPPKKEKLIIACNHLSIRDIFMIGAMFPGRQIHFFAKKELFKNRFVNRIFRMLGAIPVSRGEFDFYAIKSVVNVLNKNKTIGIFPEGTRNKYSPEEMLGLKNGVALFSLKTGAKILPLYQLRKSRFFRRNYVYFGEIFDFSEIEGDKLDKEKLDKATAVLTERMNDARTKLYEYVEKNNIKFKSKNNDEEKQ